MGNLKSIESLDDKNEQDLTWECIAGEPGSYMGTSFIREGCGIIPPLQPIFGNGLIKRSCPCEKRAHQDEQEREERFRLERDMKHRTYTWLGYGWTDSALAHKTFEQFNSALQQEAYDMVRDFADSLSGTLILRGTYGTGKTHLLAGLANHLRTRKGKPVATRFAASPMLFQSIAEHMNHHQSYTDLIHDAIQVPLLILDDIDKAKYSEFREEIYFSIFDGRAKAGKPTAISTNRLDDLEHFVGGACASRLSIGQIEVDMAGGDYRKGL